MVGNKKIVDVIDKIEIRAWRKCINIKKLLTV